MSKEILKEENIDNKDISSKKKEKLFNCTNKHNAPYEFHIGTKYFRLEPRGKEGDSIILKEKQIKNKDFEICDKHVVIKEKENKK